MQLNSPPIIVTKKETANLLYTLYPNGIHEFVVTHSGHAAVDELIAIFADLYAVTPIDQTLLRLFVISGGLPSVAYTIRQTKQLVARFQKLPKSRNAVIHDDNLALTLLSPSIRFLPFANTMPLGFFRPDERDRAIEWLLK